MVKRGQQLEIRALDFSSLRHEGIPVEVLDRRELLRRIGRDALRAPERPAFHIVLLVHSGSGTQRVDFADVRLVPGRLIHLRPGQVQEWDVDSACEASVVVCRPVELDRAAWFPEQPPYRDLDADSLETARGLVDALRREQDRFEPTPAASNLMLSLFRALVDLFPRVASPEPEARAPAAYVAFRTALEGGIGRTHTVRALVSELGYSERTVDRACRRATGRSAKTLLDERLVLEARRQLAHTDLPAAAIAADLGFPDPTNFHKYFRRHTGERPGDFRRRIRIGSPRAPVQARPATERRTPEPTRGSPQRRPR